MWMFNDGGVHVDVQYMRRAMELAEKSAGYTNPNPLVGAVIVKGGRIIGEGCHKVYGGPHAEIEAFMHAAEDVAGAVMFVTLEPCSHFGKTPPCARAIIEKKIAKVVIGMEDPNPLVAGKGLKCLKDHGIEVVTGVLEREVRKMNEIYIKYITEGRPFCILKTAMTLDGKTATHTGDSRWISNELSRQFVHGLRHRVSGIMTGIGTVLTDDPELTTRLKDSTGKDPVRVIVDSTARIPLESKVLNVNSKAGTILAVTENADKDKLNAIRQKGAEVIINPQKDGHVDLQHLFGKLGAMQIDSILAEGGSALNHSLLREGLADKVLTFIAPKIVGGSAAKTPVGGAGIEWMRDAIVLEEVEIRSFGGDILVEGYVRKE